MFLEIQGKIVDPLNRELNLKELTKHIPANTYISEWTKREDGKLECSFRCISVFFLWYNNIFADLKLENLNNDKLEPFNKVPITENMIDKESFGLLTMMCMQPDDDSCDDDVPNDMKEEKPDFIALLAHLEYEGGTMADYVQKHMKEFETMVKNLEDD